MKKIWALLLGIALVWNVTLVVFAGGDIDGSELKEIRVPNALWAWDSSVRGFTTARFSKGQCFLLAVELPVKDLRGEQIGKFIDQAGSTFELVAVGKPKVTARVFEARNYRIDGKSTFCFALVIPDEEFSKIESDLPYLLTTIKQDRDKQWIIEKEIWLTKPYYLPDMPAVKTEQIKFTAEIDNKKYQLEAMIYRPDDQGRHPLIVMNHGRNGPHPVRYQNEVSGYRALNEELVSKGYVVMMLVRRGYGNSDGPDSEFQRTAVQSGLEAAKDIKSAVDFMREQEYVAGDKALIMGHSQGGWAALSSATVKMDGVLGVVNLCGGTNYGENGHNIVQEPGLFMEDILRFFDGIGFRE